MLMVMSELNGVYLCMVTGLYTYFYSYPTLQFNVWWRSSEKARLSLNYIFMCWCHFNISFLYEGCFKLCSYAAKLKQQICFLGVCNKLKGLCLMQRVFWMNKNKVKRCTWLPHQKSKFDSRVWLVLDIKRTFIKRRLEEEWDFFWR